MTCRLQIFPRFFQLYELLLLSKGRNDATIFGLQYSSRVLSTNSRNSNRSLYFFPVVFLCFETLSPLNCPRSMNGLYIKYMKRVSGHKYDRQKHLFSESFSETASFLMPYI
ncbi:hypothetical protein ABKN59_010903 [Abortiporus biennis]